MELEQAHGVAHGKLLGTLRASFYPAQTPAQSNYPTDNLEMLLLLVGEHLQHTHDQPNLVRSATQLGISTAGPIGGFSSMGDDAGDALLGKLGRLLEPTLQRLDGLQLVSRLRPTIHPPN